MASSRLLADTIERRRTRIAPTLLDPDLEQQFARDGFVTLDALDEHDLETARRCWEVGNPQPGQGFEYDVVRQSPEDTARVEAAVGPMWDALLERTLAGHQRFLLSFLTKWPGADSAHHLHQDWTYLDERRYRTLSYWVALDDCSEELGNGPVSVIPGSHLLVDAFRGPAVDDWYRDLREELEQHLVPIDLRAGQAILLDSALLHGSAPNRSNGPRRGMATAVAPRDVTFWFAAPGVDDQVTISDLGRTYFALFDPSAPAIADRPVLASVPRLTTVDATALRSLLGDDKLPDDLDQAPPPDTEIVTGYDAIADHIRAEMDAALTAGWTGAPARFLPQWAPGANPDGLVLPLVLDGAPTLAGREAFGQTVAAIERAQPSATAWLVQVRADSSWTQLAPRPGVALSATVGGTTPCAGSVTVDGVRLAERVRRCGPSAVLRNTSTQPVWVLLVASASPARRRWRAGRDRHLRQTDEVVAAVRPNRPQPEEATR